jgi:hypothetical protein
MPKHQFLLAENPLKPDEEELYIYSRQKGERALFKVSTIDTEEIFETFEEGPLNIVYFSSSDTGDPEFYHIELHDNIEIELKAVESITQEALKWFKQFLIKQDQFIQTQSKAKRKQEILQDFSESVKGLKLIHDHSSKKWLLIYEDLSQVFSSEVEADQWMKRELKIDEHILENGCVNELE